MFVSLHGVKQSWDISSQRCFSSSEKANNQQQAAEPWESFFHLLTSPESHTGLFPPREDLAWRTHLRAANKTKPYPAGAKPSVLVVLRMRRSPQRRQLRLHMSRPSCSTGSSSAVGCAGSYCMARPSVGILQAGGHHCQWEGIAGENSELKEGLGTGMGCPGRQWSHRPWMWLKKVGCGISAMVQLIRTC